MQRLLLTLFILGIGLIGNGQATEGNGNAKIIGTIIDSATHQPIEYATITLFEKGNKKVVNGTTSDRSGSFTITNVPAGNYSVETEFIGYKAQNIDNIS